MAPTSPREMLEALARNLPNRTGKTLEQWARMVKTKGPKTTRERVAWLRMHHSLGGPTAAVIVAKAEGQDLAAPYEAGDELVEAMFSGAKTELKPIYEAAVKTAQALGRDVVVSPRKTYVTFTRKRQFAAIQPSTRTRVDLGLVLPGVKAKGRLEQTDRVGGGRVTHCIALTEVGDFNAEVKKWLKAAYEQDG